MTLTQPGKPFCSIQSSFRKKYFLPVSISFLFLSANFAFATPPPDSDSNVKKNLPTLSVAEGILSFVGDVGYTHLNQPLLASSGFQIELQKHIYSDFSLSLFLLSGKVFGNEKTVSRNVNFQSGIVSEGLQVRYDFNSKKNPKQILTPFVSAGFEYVVFHPKADLKDASGNYYHYWKDGSIRSIEQADVNAGSAVILHRDYNYETELSDANLDGLGKFKQSALAFPIGVGLHFRISGRCSMDFSSVCHFTNTDLIDGVTSESSGSRKGNAANDKFIYSSVSFRYDFSAPRETPRKVKQDKVKPKIDVTNVDFTKLEKEDSDHDGVPDIGDEDAQTPPNVKVDTKGRPLDSDGDGVPDYKDEEPNSLKNSVVNENGVTITDEMIQKKLMRDSLAALPAIREYLKSFDELKSGNPSSKLNTSTIGDSSKESAISALYRKVDTDSNGIISSKEISASIDEYLEGKSSYSSEEFYRLIDFFFRQK